MIDRGRLVAEGPTSEIRKMRRAPAVDVTARGDDEAIARALKAAEGVASVKKTETSSDGAVTFRCAWAKKTSDADAAKATEQIVAALVAGGFAVREVRASGGSLEDVFRDLTRGQAGDASDDADGEEAS